MLGHGSCEADFGGTVAVGQALLRLRPSCSVPSQALLSRKELAETVFRETLFVFISMQYIL